VKSLSVPPSARPARYGTRHESKKAVVAMAITDDCPPTVPCALGTTGWGYKDLFRYILVSVILTFVGVAKDLDARH